MAELISHLGVIGSGKDYRSRVFEEQGYVHIDFKDALVEMCSDIVGYDIREDYEWFKSHLIGMRRPSNRLSEAYCHTDTREMLERHKGIMTGRMLLQRVGTEVMRKRDANYWCREFEQRVFKQLAEGKSIVNSDCRFLNEVQSIIFLAHSGKDLNAKFIFCDYRSKRYEAGVNHESEKLATLLLQMGFKDGDEIDEHHFISARQIMNGEGM